MGKAAMELHPSQQLCDEQEHVLQELRYLLNCRNNAEIIDHVTFLLDGCKLQTEASNSDFCFGNFALEKEDSLVRESATEHNGIHSTATQTSFCLTPPKRHCLVGLDVKAYFDCCSMANSTIPPIINFWRYLDLHRIQCYYMISTFFNIPHPNQYMELAEFDEIWKEARCFRPMLAALVTHGLIQFEDSELFCVYFGNLAAYNLTFMMQYSHQVRKRLYDSSRFTPEEPVVRIEYTLTPEECEAAWKKVNPYALEYFLNYIHEFPSSYLASIDKLFQDERIYSKHYPPFGKAYVHRIHYLIVYQEAVRIHTCYKRGVIPLMYPRRQLRCLPYTQTRITYLSLEGVLNNKAIHCPSSIDESITGLPDEQM